MPELPEVETVVRGIGPLLEGRAIRQVEVRTRKLRVMIPHAFEETLEGRTVEGVERRAKYCLIRLSGGWVWALHLGMSGQVRLDRGLDFTRPHDHVKVTFDDGQVLLYHDPRRFGLMTVIKASDLDRHPLMKDLGPEPLASDFNVFYLHGKLRGKTVPVKQALMDQRIVVGVGNIYANEALFRAGIMPFKESGRVSNAALQALVPAVKTVLEEAIAAGGSTLRDYVRSTGDLGYFQHHFEVYERENKPCPRCGLPIKRAVLGGRATYYCEGCQR